MSKIVIRILWALLGATIVTSVFAYWAINNGWIGYMPPIEELQNPINRYATQIYSSDGKIREHGTIIRKIVSWLTIHNYHHRWFRHWWQRRIYVFMTTLVLISMLLDVRLLKEDCCARRVQAVAPRLPNSWQNNFIQVQPIA